MPFVTFCLKEADIEELIETTVLCKKLWIPQIKKFRRMKGPYNCSKLFGTWCRPKTVTLSSYNTLIQEKHRYMCVVNETYYFQGNIPYLQTHCSLFQTWTIH